MRFDKLILITAWCVGIAAGVMGASAPALASDDLPRAEEVMGKYLEAVGGQAALEKLHNRVVEGMVEIPEQELKLAITVYEAEPNKRYVLLESEGTGRIERGTDGQVAWSEYQVYGPRILEGGERDKAVRDGFFHKELKWRERYEKVECVGVETVEAKPCYKLLATPAQGKPETWYFDQASGLRAKMVRIDEGFRGEVTTEVLIEEYKEVDGVLLPCRLKETRGGQESLITLKSIRHNVETPLARLVLPEHIQNLVEIQAEMAQEEAEGSE